MVDPLWAQTLEETPEEVTCLNPSFNGLPTLGLLLVIIVINNIWVLIPLLVDDPLWEFILQLTHSQFYMVFLKK